MPWVEIVGYVGMAFLLVAFMMKDIKWLRILNIVGGIICCIYGFLTATYATAALNLSLCVINLSAPFRYYISFKRKQKEDDKRE